VGRTRWRKRRGMLSSKVTRADWVEKRGIKPLLMLLKVMQEGKGRVKILRFFSSPCRG